MSFIPDELKFQTFACPKCGQIISSEVEECRFCSFKITYDIRLDAIRKESAEKKNILLRSRTNTLVVGVVITLIGLGQLFSPLVAVQYGSSQVPCLMPILVLVGLVLVIMSLVGYVTDKRS